MRQSHIRVKLASLASMGCSTTHCMIFSAQSPSQNSCKSYASNSWWGFSNANDRQKIFAFFRPCIRTGFCSPDLADFHDLYISWMRNYLTKSYPAQTISYGHS